MLVKCLNCGKEFPVRGTLRKITAKFCSFYCKADYAKKHSGAIRRCRQCEKEFYVKGNPQQRGFFCSRKCFTLSRRTGKFIKCAICGRIVWRHKVHLKDINFCSIECANLYQGRNKIEFICKICGAHFKWSKSRITQANPTYCSLGCRNKDTEHLRNCGLSSTLKQQKKRGLNKLELAGGKILRDIGLEFNEQVLMFDKFLVDVLLRDRRVIIQWDGEYWHTKPKRKRLDESQDAYLTKCGYKILRITDSQMKNNLEKVIANIRRTI